MLKNQHTFIVERPESLSARVGSRFHFYSLVLGMRDAEEFEARNRWKILKIKLSILAESFNFYSSIGQ